MLSRTILKSVLCKATTNGPCIDGPGCLVQAPHEDKQETFVGLTIDVNRLALFSLLLDQYRDEFSQKASRREPCRTEPRDHQGRYLLGQQR